MFYDVAVPILYRRIKTNNFASLLEGANEDYHEEDSDDEDTENDDSEDEESEDEDFEDDDSENEDSEDDDSEDEDTRNEDTEDDETEDEAPYYSPQESLKNSDSKASWKSWPILPIFTSAHGRTKNRSRSRSCGKGAGRRSERPRSKDRRGWKGNILCKMWKSQGL